MVTAPVAASPAPPTAKPPTMSTALCEARACTVTAPTLGASVSVCVVVVKIGNTVSPSVAPGLVG